MPIRTFLALDLEPATRARLAGLVSELPDPGEDLRPVAPENLHVTIKFLGEVPDAALAGVLETAEAVAGLFEPFEWSLGPLRCIPPRGRALRMIWATVIDPSGRMTALAGELEQALIDAPVKHERRGFRGHVTLARVKNTRRANEIRAEVRGLEPGPFAKQWAEELVAYNSVLSPDGAIHTPVARGPLGR